MLNIASQECQHSREHACCAGMCICTFLQLGPAMLCYSAKAGLAGEIRLHLHRQKLQKEEIIAFDELKVEVILVYIHLLIKLAKDSPH